MGEGPGSKAGVIRVWRVWRPSKASGAPSCQVAPIARIAATHSAMRSTGADQVDPKRRSTWARTCVPSPRANRPSASRARSHASWARWNGERGKAMATLV